MDTQATGLETFNAIGFGALIVLVLSWVGGIVCFFAFNRFRDDDKSLGEAMKSVWGDPKDRREHLIFTGVCFVGVLASLVGFLWGGWPRS
jgi:hypothetical protein